MIKKILALTLCALMFLTASCSGQSTELLDFIDSTASGEVDLEGKTFSFASSWYSEWYAFSDDVLPTEAVEKMMTRFHSIKDKYNAEFEMVEMTEDEIAKLLITGADFPEMLDATAQIAYDLYKSNAITSLNGLTAVDLSDSKWGEPNFIQYGNFAGEQYGFYPWHWEFIPQFDGAVIFNGEMIGSFGGIHPYELQENDKWNWDSFETELKKYAIVDNETQYYGALVSYDKMAKSAIHSNGGKVIEGDYENGYTFGLTSDRAIQALDWLKKLNDEGLFETDGGIEAFTKSHLAPYWINESYFGTVFNPNDAGNDTFCPAALNDYGFIPFPTGPQGDATDVGCYVYKLRRLNYISEISDIEPENIGVLINYIFEPLDDSLSEGWKDLAQRLIFTENNNQKCVDNFIYILENMGYDYSVQMTSSAYDSLNSAFSSIVNGTKSPTEALTNLEDVIMSEFTK